MLIISIFYCKLMNLIIFRCVQGEILKTKKLKKVTEEFLLKTSAFLVCKIVWTLLLKIKVNYSYQQVTNLMLKTWVKSRIKQICCKLVLPLSYGKNAVYPTISDFDRELLVCLCLCHRKLLIHVFGTDSLGFVCPCLCLSSGFPGLFLGPFTVNKKSSIFSQISILFS